MATKRIVVVGGSAAGPKAAARAKRLAPEAEVLLLQKEPELSMASCGYPYYVGTTCKERNQLLCTPTGVVRDPAFFKAAKGVVARVRTEVTALDTTAKTLTARNLETGASETIAYDKLILCTGAVPKLPPIPGRELSGVTPLHSLADADRLRALRSAEGCREAVVVGGGLIGMETAEALAAVGLKVTVVELLPQTLTFLDEALARLVENHARAKGVTIMLENGVAEFTGEDGRLTGVRLQDGGTLPCRLAVVAIGVGPNAALAREAGIAIGATGGIAVDEHMRTSAPDVYAAGDCVELTHRITGKKVLAPFGDLANLEGRVAGENAAKGDRATFPGTVQSGICKIFDFAAGSTGLSERRARAEGYDVVSVINAGLDKPGFMGTAKLLISKMVADAKTRRVLGFQCIGPGEANRQVAEAAVAVSAGMTVDDLANLDLPYAPPFSLAIDHFLATAHVLQNKMDGLLKGEDSLAVKARLDDRAGGGKPPVLLDVRAPDEFEQMRLGLGEVHIPLGKLRLGLEKGLPEGLPADKDAEIIAYCKISMRGYEAERILEAAGYTNVTVMEGGIMAWPFAREK
ncbi:Pyridine nucleotide-disulfide oxidoreductase, FAD/NAD(P)-binding domain containing protein [Desulfovibrio sp. X2]|uniref:FAD-dependent oxidoreductase n=1 Tax=Desulfovibrio sp. X2 TaxID=941449 RepID=UPI0003587EDB|nr:FAD-dependent oxidoreductase [Desulfovibrio sp. X2]EPR43490.1 Pyridine nucleotide-disulfide oxidoreductase, FAD/NAD(P)-binding domain containing protein [Desulfovibrio sp. X2]